MKIIDFVCDFAIFNGQLVSNKFKDIQDNVLNLKIRDEDVWLCCFPKTGSTWLHELLWLVANDFNFDGAKEYHEIRTPFLERSIVYDVEKMKKVYPGIEKEKFVMDTISHIETINDPRVIKTHLFWDNLPKALKDGNTRAKIVYVTRNPKDTAISMYNYNKIFSGYQGSLEEFCETFLKDQVESGPFWKHVLSFWERRSYPNILFLKYEEMKNDLRDVIIRVAKFLGKTVNEEQMKKMLQHLDFSSTKRNKFINNEDFKEFVQRFHTEDKIVGHFMYRGKVGNFKEEMSVELIKKFDDWTEENFAGTGLNFNV